MNNKQSAIGKKEPSSIQWVNYIDSKKISIICFYFLIHILDSNEYFYKKQQQITTNTSDNQISSNSSIDPNDDRIGESDEFDQMIQHYYQKKHHSKQ